MTSAIPIATDASLPRPEARPRADVVIFDGHCSICRSQVKRLAGWDRHERLAYLSLHDDEVANRYPDLRHDDLMRNMYVVDRHGGRHRGAAAIRYLARRLPALWWLSPILSIPGTMPLWQWLYQQVATRRYLFGRVEACDGMTCRLHDRGRGL
jgi:predicted DCC family thiol-disulfide oxidoreductase YuxK